MLYSRLPHRLQPEHDMPSRHAAQEGWKMLDKRKDLWLVHHALALGDRIRPAQVRFPGSIYHEMAIPFQGSSTGEAEW